MNLVKEDLDKENEKTKKMAKIVLILIILLTSIVLCVGAYTMYLGSTGLEIYLNSSNANDLEGKMLLKEDKSIYLSIRYLAEKVGYKTYSGESKSKSEDPNKCYIETESEIIDFVVNSNKIEKTSLLQTENKYKYENLKYPIEYINEEMYINAEDLQSAMRITFQYDQQQNKIQMYTISKLVEIYAKKVISYGYTEISKNPLNNISIFDNVLIVNKEEKVGAIQLETGKEILETKYDDVVYLEETKEFLVTADEKKGIISKEGKTVIGLKYEDIMILSKKEGIYIVKEDGKYGLANIKGTQILYPKYEKIGIDISDFKENQVENPYLIGNNLIPVKYKEKWGLVNTSGKLMTDIKYDRLGYISHNQNDEFLNLLIIPKYNAVVVKKDVEEKDKKVSKYTILGANGDELYPIKLDDIYLKMDEEKRSYVIVMGENKYDAEEQLKKLGLKSIIDDGEGKNINSDIK